MNSLSTAQDTLLRMYGNISLTKNKQILKVPSATDKKHFLKQRKSRRKNETKYGILTLHKLHDLTPCAHVFPPVSIFAVRRSAAGDCRTDPQHRSRAKNARTQRRYRFGTMLFQGAFTMANVIAPLIRNTVIDRIVVVSVSCIYGLGSADAYKAMMVPLAVKQEINRNATLTEPQSLDCESENVA